MKCVLLFVWIYFQFYVRYSESCISFFFFLPSSLPLFSPHLLLLLLFVLPAPFSAFPSPCFETCCVTLVWRDPSHLSSRVCQPCMGGSVALPTAWDRLPRCLCLPALGAVCREPDEGGRGGVGAPGSNTGKSHQGLGDGGVEAVHLCDFLQGLWERVELHRVGSGRTPCGDGAGGRCWNLPEHLPFSLTDSNTGGLS